MENASATSDFGIGELEYSRDAECPDPEFATGNAQPRRLPMLIGICALTLFFTPQTLQLFPGLEGLQIAKVTAVAAVLIFLFSRGSWSSRLRLGASPQLKCVLGLLVLATVTIPMAEWPGASLRYVTDVYIKNIIFVYLLYQAVRTDRDCRAIAGVLTFGSTLLVLAILIGFGPLAVAKTDPNRFSVGATYDSNDLALLLVVTIPFAFFLIKPSRPLVRVFLISSIVLMLIGMLKTGSRGGFLGLLVIGFLAFMRGSRQARKYTLITLALGASMIAFAAPASYWERIGTIYKFEDDYNVNEESGRFAIWKAGLGMIAERPLTGIGIACFNIAEGRINHSKLQQSPHNSFVQATAELGLPGGFLFVAIIITSVRVARRARRRAAEAGDHVAAGGAVAAVGDESVAAGDEAAVAGDEAASTGRQASAAAEQLMWFASAVEVAFLGFAVSGFFLSHAYSGIFCFLAGIGAVLQARYKSSNESARPAAEEIEYA
jgi:O-antigen ligase